MTRPCAQIADLIITAVNGSRTLDEGSDLPEDVLDKFSGWGWLVLNVCEARALPEAAGALHFCCSSHRSLQRAVAVCWTEGVRSLTT